MWTKLLSAVLSCLALASAAPIKSTAADEGGSRYLEKYSVSEGAVILIDSGVMYKVLKSGDEGGPPLAHQKCSCHYEGRLSSNMPDGPTFDSSIARGQPSSFAPHQVIPAWTEAMQIMTVGSKWEIVCPPETAYGHEGRGERIPANSVLVFTLEMLSCEPVAPPAVVTVNLHPYTDAEDPDADHTEAGIQFDEDGDVQVVTAHSTPQHNNTS